MSEAGRRTYLDQLRRILPPSPAWEAWLAATAELPPDFDGLRSIPGLPDPLVRTDEGRTEPVTDYSQWDTRRDELKAAFQTFDKDGSGRISEAELKSVMYSLGTFVWPCLFCP